MKIITHKPELQTYLKSLREYKATVGFVPTMGALHRGHLSLINHSLSEHDITACSIFVNPAQFNDNNDFMNYPRTLQADIELLKKTGCNVLFVPSVEEMFPDHEFAAGAIENGIKVIDLGHLDSVMEGKYRPGHFQGVVLIVRKLFETINPDTAYFGEKDYQQLMVIKHMVNLLKISVKITGCPIVREDNGMAMSSRNALLSADQKADAAMICKTLKEMTEKSAELGLKDAVKWVEKRIAEIPALHLEYFEISDPESLLPADDWKQAKKFIACIAVFAGKVRLIDNIMFPSPAFKQ